MCTYRRTKKNLGGEYAQGATKYSARKKKKEKKSVWCSERCLAELTTNQLHFGRLLSQNVGNTG